MYHCFVIFLNILLILFVYLIREYFLRRVRDEFRQNQNVQDSSEIAVLLKHGQKSLEMIRRQVN